MTANKLDAEKPRLDLIDYSFLEGLGQVLAFGAKKYEAHNWRKGLDISRLIAAAMRHTGQFNNGQTLDDESCLCHLYHAAANLMMASWMLQNKPELDNRWKNNNASESL